MAWIFFLILTILTWGSYNLFFKFLGNNLDYYLVIFLIGITLALGSIPIIIYKLNSGNFEVDSKLIIFPIIMGVLLFAGNIFFFSANAQGAPASIAISSFAIGAMMLGVIGGYAFFNESFNLQRIFGLVLGMISIILLVTGSK